MNTQSFDEELYLSKNPDVKAAVERGECESGLAHYLAYGQAENRPGAPYPEDEEQPGVYLIRGQMPVGFNSPQAGSHRTRIKVHSTQEIPRRGELLPIQASTSAAIRFEGPWGPSSAPNESTRTSRRLCYLRPARARRNGIGLKPPFLSRSPALSV
jgi:hypothetical protein